MSADALTQSKRVLEPMDRISEIWFGLVMVLTYTCSLSVREAGHVEVHSMLVSALGCNLAWGILDGFMYLVGRFIERARSMAALHAVRNASDPGRAAAVVAAAMPPLLASVSLPAELQAISQRLKQLPEASVHPSLLKRDWLGALGVFQLVFLSTFPVVVPFLLTSDVRLALRISNGVALLMLFLTGYAFGLHAQRSPWGMGAAMVAVAGPLVALTIVLGG